jgi:hypothetical protein
MLVALLTSPGAHAEGALLMTNRNNHAEAFAVKSAPTLSLADIETGGSRSATLYLYRLLFLPSVMIDSRFSQHGAHSKSSTVTRCRW